MLKQTEKKFLKHLVETDDVNFSYIANKLKITRQAVSKIKKKLEEKSVLEGYNPKVNVDKLGITIFALMDLKLTKNNAHTELLEDLKKREKVVYLFEVTVPEKQIVLFSGFKTVKQIQEFIESINTSFPEVVQSFSVKLVHPEDIHKNTYKDLVLHAISDRQ
ncbi:MAG: hypothetical protein COU25_03705 [Candidatus Levybacteria bacterium CG10_big_fil_rev_8_21_14_0_10_35_13]|nr:MAG: hypothetical protein COU25_03705 [Candidatus Levybacteria bacterium CG10_big_fil_rev_8_21_14_0_10_35_13]